MFNFEKNLRLKISAVTKSGRKRQRSIDSSRFKTIKVNFQLLDVGDSRYKRTCGTGRGQNTMKRRNLFARTRCQGLPEANFNFDIDCIYFSLFLSSSLLMNDDTSDCKHHAYEIRSFAPVTKLEIRNR